MALILVSLGIFKSIGPALAIAVAVTRGGRRSRWSRRSCRCSAPGSSGPRRPGAASPTSARFAALGRSLGSDPVATPARPAWCSRCLAIFALSFNPNFDLGDSGAPKTVESRCAAGRSRRASRPAPPTPRSGLRSSHQRRSFHDDRDTAYAANLARASPASAGRPRPSRPTSSGRRSYSVVLTGDPTSDAALDAVKGPICATSPTPRPRRDTKALVGGDDLDLRGHRGGDGPRLQGRLPGRRAS